MKMHQSGTSRADMRDILSFLYAWVSDPGVVGAVAPSGAALANLIASEITSNSAPVLEFGPGTGAFTRVLLERGVRQEDLILVEYRSDFANLLQHQFPRARVLQMDAARLSRQKLFDDARLGAVVSGLPLLNMPQRKVLAILAGAFSYLRPGGALYQFTYGPRCPVPRPFLDRLGLKATKLGRALLNIPPAAVYRLTKRRPLASEVARQSGSPHLAPQTPGSANYGMLQCGRAGSESFMRVLLIEDEPEMIVALSAALRRYDVVVDSASGIAEGEAALMTDVHDAVLLDRQLPDGDGLSLLSKLRARGSEIPVIILTARGELADRIAGLDIGADDYLVKPFAVEELLARLRAIRRRPPNLATDAVRVGRLRFDFTHREASIEGNRLDLPRRELLVLETLLRRLGRTVLRSSLEEAVYSFDDEIQSNALDTHVSRLRRKLADTASGVEIHGIRGVGYLLRPTS